MAATDKGPGGERYAAGLDEAQIASRSGGARVVKLDSNENPLGCSPRAAEAMARAARRAHRYPPAQAGGLHAALARRLGVGEERVVSAAGSVRLLEALLRLTCRPGRDSALAFAPCFPGFAHRARQCGVALRQAPLEPHYAQDLAALADAAGADTRLVYVANPDNPTGRAVAGADIAALARRLPEHSLLVVDEAYIDYADAPRTASVTPLLAGLPRVAVVGTFSKAWGLAGARVGFGVLPEALAEEFKAGEAPFAVGGMALAGALAALEDEDFRLRAVAAVREGRRLLEAELGRLGCRPVPSQGSHVLFRPPMEAGRVFEGLLERGVAVRPMDFAGLPGWLRVSVGAADENRLFVEALERVLDRGAG